MSTALRLLVDIGNSGLHWGLDRRGWEHSGHEPHSEGPEAAVNVCRQVEQLSGVPDVVAYCSVVPSAEQHLMTVVRERWGRLALRYGDALPTGLQIRYDDPTTVGDDRLAAALAAWKLAPQGAVVVDCGTAITVDAVGPGGVFLGGFIAPGVEAAAASLLERAALLRGPSGDMREWLGQAPAGLGRNTMDCLRAGIGRGHAGLVERLVKEGLEALGADAAVIGCGRAAQVLRDLGAPIEQIRPHLVLDGLTAACDLVEANDLLMLAGGRAVEIKRHLNKPTEQYDCEVLRWSRDHVVLRYVTDREVTFSGIVIRAGSETIAHYWPGRDYILWRFRGPDHAAVGHLLHLIEDLRVAPGRLEYCDMILDLWVPSSGEPRVLDEKELTAAVTDRKISAARAEQLRMRMREIVASLDTVLTEIADPVEPGP